MSASDEILRMCFCARSPFVEQPGRTDWVGYAIFKLALVFPPSDPRSDDDRAHLLSLLNGQLRWMWDETAKHLLRVTL